MNYLAVCAVSLCCVLTVSCYAVGETAADRQGSDNVVHGVQVNTCTDAQDNACADMEQVNACTERFMLNGKAISAVDSWNHQPSVNNVNKAKACYQKLVDQGNNEALIYIAMIYDNGMNLSPAQKKSPLYIQSSQKKALQYYQQCESKKNRSQAVCQVMLAEMYLRQGHSKQQCAKARDLIQKSADAGDPWGAKDLAHFNQVCPAS